MVARVITATMLFLQFLYLLVVLCGYSKRLDPRSCPGTMPVKSQAALTRHSQIQPKALT